MNTLLATLCSDLGLKQEHTALLNERDTRDVWRQFSIWLDEHMANKLIELLKAAPFIAESGKESV